MKATSLRLTELTSVIFDGDFAEILRLLLAKKVGDAVSRHTKQPSRYVLDGHEETIGFHQSVENILKNVLSVTWIGNPPPDEAPQTGLFPLHNLRDTLVLFEHHPFQARRFVHPLV